MENDLEQEEMDLNNDDQNIDNDDQNIDQDDQKPEEIEAWMADDDETEQTDSDLMPVSAHIRAKRKLKGRISDQTDEIERLKTENEQLKAKTTPKNERPVRPRRDDFDDDEQYEAALDNYEDERDTFLLGRATQETSVRENQQKTQQNITKAVDSHYDRAEKLLESAGISAENYKQADLEVRQSVESIRKGQGDQVVDYMISLLGDGSEKVMYKLGRSKALRGEFLSALIEDPSGLKAAAFLGHQKATLLNTTKRKSNTPPPETDINGDEKATAQAGSLKRKYDEAHKRGNTQTAFDLKREAKQAGVDTSKW